MRPVKIHTTEYSFFGKGFFKPSSPVFEIRNEGPFDFKIGSSFILKPQQSFGINMEKIVAGFKQKGYQVINDTQFDLQVAPPPAPTGGGPGNIIALAIWVAFIFSTNCSVKETQINL